MRSSSNDSSIGCLEPLCVYLTSARYTCDLQANNSVCKLSEYNGKGLVDGPKSVG